MVLSNKSIKDVEALEIFRLIMVFGGFAPLFVLWSIEGTVLFPDKIFCAVMAFFAIVPNIIIYLRIMIAKKNHDESTIDYTEVARKNENIIVYLLAILIPIFGVNIVSLRDFIAVIAAVVFVMLVFWKSDLQYINIIFTLFGYNIIQTTIERTDRFGITGDADVILFTRKKRMIKGKIPCYRLTDYVYIEK